VDNLIGSASSDGLLGMFLVVITAQENGLNIYEYLNYLFLELPKRRKSKDPSILGDCAPALSTYHNTA